MINKDSTNVLKIWSYKRVYQVHGWVYRVKDKILFYNNEFIEYKNLLSIMMTICTLNYSSPSLSSEGEKNSLIVNKMKRQIQN